MPDQAQKPRIKAENASFVRLAEEHIGGILAIEAEAYPEAWSEQMFQDEICHPHSHFYVMMLDGQIVGYGGFWLVLDEAHITSITVRQDYRGKGLGRILLAYLLNLSEKLGAVMAALEVRMSNVIAQNLYGSEGFEPIGIRRKYYAKTGEDAMVMVLQYEKRPGRQPSGK